MKYLLYSLLIIIGIVGGFLFYKMFFYQKTTVYDFFGNYQTNKEDPIGLEWEAFKVFKEKPLESSVNYLAVPWIALAQRNQLQEVSKLRLKGGFTVCDCLTGIIGQRTFAACKQVGIDCIFSPCATRRQFINGIRIEPFPYFSANGSNPNENKDILYSFIGCDTHPTRRQIFSMDHLEGSFIKQRPGFHYFLNEQQQKMNKVEYKEILARSRFSLCPRGNEPSSIRFYESLQAEAIPILIADEIVLPQNYDWNQCIIRVAERNVANIPSIIAAITPERERAMRQACKKAYEQFSGKNFVSSIRHYYNKNRS